MLREVNSGGYVKSLIVLAAPCLVFRVEGYFSTSAATDFYVQIHDAVAVPANGAVPLKSYQAQANFAFAQHIGEGLPCKTGCVVVLSSTSDTLTIATLSTDKADFFVDIEEYQTLAVKPVLTTNIYTNQAGSIQLWAEAAGPKRIVSLVGTEANGVSTWLQLYACDSPGSPGVVIPIRTWLVAASAAFNIQFGLNGIPVYSADGPNGPLRKGCTIGFSTGVANVYDGSGAFNITETHY